MKNSITIDLSDVLQQELGGSISIPATIDIQEVLDFTDTHTHELDLDHLLAKENKVALVWTIDDVKARRPDLDDDQAWQVLERAKEDHESDRCHLDFIESTADGIFPLGEAAKERLRERVAVLLRQIDALPSDDRLNPAAYGVLAAKLDDAEEAVRKTGGAA